MLILKILAWLGLQITVVAMYGNGSIGLECFLVAQLLLIEILNGVKEK